MANGIEDDGDQKISAQPAIRRMKTVLFILTEDWFFLSHFQPMARAMTSTGLQVVVAARPSAAAEKITALGYRFVPLEIGRSGISPLGVARSVLNLRGIISEIKPDVIHAVALPPVVVTALATGIAFRNRPIILAPTGLGHLWIENDLVTKITRECVRLLIALSARRSSTHFIFENGEDPAEFGIDPRNSAKVTLVGGAGVSPTQFVPTPLPASPPLHVAIVARMTGSKGIAPAVEAVRRLRETGRDIRLDLFGTPDDSNKRSISRVTLEHWSGAPGVMWHGHTSNPADIWKHAHVAVLLSWREGLPRSLVEAMACGRPVVATNVPGCRTLVRDGIEGFLVAPENPEATASALQALYDSPERRTEMGIASRERFEDGFTEGQVERATAALYEKIISDSGHLP